MTGNPLYDAWKAKGFVKAQGGRGINSLRGWDRPMPDGVEDYLKTFGEDYLDRQKLTRKYSWAIPSPEAIRWIADRVKSIVEIGAGRGYWAKMLSSAQAKIDVVAYDNSINAKGEMGRNGYHQNRKLGEKVNDPTLFFPVQRGGPIRCAEHGDRTLFLCWPPHSSRMARQCLKYYQGNSLLYVGEWDGCCADPKFFEQLEKDWKEIGSFDLPQWPNIHDGLWLLGRK